MEIQYCEETGPPAGLGLDKGGKGRAIPYGDGDGSSPCSEGVFPIR